ncbi:hypothetical protein Q4488_14070 [Amphritea sp. 1_MG-2023]|uniref:hypothetical protein n=1 Tax=Amphritea sp. 1_MG-2023 TaxID=3062670 RepID=UPI0026E14B73|nr:hypothetical protein [Amphritea sp. 1_MG-2023]MDO6564513.1 hypothetical protein [Amphritea sp. 1_MG-2023]
MGIVSSSLVALMLLTLPDASGKLLDTGEGERLNADLSLEQFSEYYLGKLKKTLSKFSTFFLIIAGLVFIQFIVGVFVLFSAIGGAGSIAAAFQQALSFGMIIWLAILVRNLINLQTEKVENDIVTTIKHRKESKSMSEEILKKAEKKAAHKITINGDNAMLAIDGGTISGSSQIKNVHGDTELMKSMALLLGYVEESGNREAISAANNLVEEATQPEPNKEKMFDLWGKITSITPQITEIISVVNSVKSLLL